MEKAALKGAGWNKQEFFEFQIPENHFQEVLVPDHKTSILQKAGKDDAYQQRLQVVCDEVVVPSEVKEHRAEDGLQSDDKEEGQQAEEIKILHAI